MKTIDKIKKYFKEDKLEVLDSGKTYGEFDTYHYSAVSLDYIHKYVLKEKVSKKFIANILLKLCEEKILRPIPCDFAGDLLFIRHNFYRSSFLIFRINNNKIINPYQYYSKYDKWVKEFNDYLKK